MDCAVLCCNGDLWCVIVRECLSILAEFLGLKKSTSVWLVRLSVWLTVNANGERLSTPIHWLYTMTLTGLIFLHSLMSPRMLTIFHLLYTMTLTSLTWILLSVILSVSYSLSARPYLLALTLFWDTLIYYRHPPVHLPTGTQTQKFKCLMFLYWAFLGAG